MFLVSELNMPQALTRDSQKAQIQISVELNSPDDTIAHLPLAKIKQVTILFPTIFQTL